MYSLVDRFTRLFEFMLFSARVPLTRLSSHCVLREPVKRLSFCQAQHENPRDGKNRNWRGAA